ncbi:MAG: hypothetical protein ACOX68_04670 [Candidatus Limivicinus sp.]
MAALLFTAACAYAGAGIFSSPKKETAELRTAAVAETAELEGIIIRREDPVMLPEGSEIKAEEGLRISAGGLLARGKENEAVPSPESGTYYRELDGFEYLSPDMLPSLDGEGLEKLMDAKPMKIPGARGKLLPDFDWYYAAFCDEGSVPEAGGKCSILFPGFEEPLDARLVSASGEDGGRKLLCFRLKGGGEEYMGLRKTPAELIFSVHRGLALPSSAVERDGEGNEFVYICTAAGTKKTAADIIYEADGLCLAEGGRDSLLREGGRVAVSARGREEKRYDNR